MKPTINVIIAGLGGQGVLKASDILADAAFRSMPDVKKAEIHGMSQRGGSVSSDVRYGDRVDSPMVPTGEADFLLVLSSDQVEVNRYQLKDDGVLIEPEAIDPADLPNRKSHNVALLGMLSTYLDIPESSWREAIVACLPEEIHDVNLKAFAIGRQAAQSASTPS